ALAVGAFAVPAALGRKRFLEPEIEERVETGARNEEDRAPMSTVAAVRASARNEFLASKAHASTSAVAGRNVDVYFVDEHAKTERGASGPRHRVTRRWLGATTPDGR